MKNNTRTPILRSFFNLIRFPNLLIIVLTQCLVRWCLIKPILAFHEETYGLLSFSHFYFILLVSSTVLIAAAGYIINDIFDQKADLINKPDKIIIGKHISEKTAYLFYWIFNVVGIAMGGYLAYQLGMINLVAIQVLTCGALWFYSDTYKRMFLVGNLVVAALAALVPLIAGGYELIAETRQYEKVYFTFGFVVAYAVFAFLMTLIREIIKDLEDMKGDRADDCRTLPIVAGTGIAKGLVIVIMLIVSGLFAFAEYNQWLTKDFVSFGYFVTLLQLPMVYLIYIVSRSVTKENYHFASSLTKLITLAGVLSMVVFKLTMEHG